ncbi:uncharacterized protein [Eurosta solidaginis]|uniref:uncharacterized protein n=1 Tax=Eurosta solidaginis TaxID=178769 RepID=UPI003530A989
MLPSSSFNSGASRSGGLSRTQRRRRNKKQLKRLQKSEDAPNTKATAPPKINNVSKTQATTKHFTTKKAESNTHISPSIKGEKQAPKDKPSLEKLPGLSDMLWQLAKEFRKRITSLQKVFDSEIKTNSQTAFQRHPPVAEIALKSGSPVTDEAYQLIRYIILEAIEKLQKSRKAATPIFYCMTNKGMYIHILCHDEYAYKFMEDCIGATMTASVHQLKVSADCVYCFSAIYKAVIKNVKQFLLQIRLHIPKMRTDHWIVVHSKVQQDETHFLFLIYELSALMLEHRYGNRLVINLNEVLFHNHGQLPNSV